MMTTFKEQTRWKVTKEEGEYVIRGKRGIVSLYGDGDINVWIQSNQMVGRIQWIPLHNYDDGADYCRKITDLDEACQYIKARKRRQVSPEMRQKLVARCARMRSGKKNLGSAGGLAADLPPNG